MQVVEKVFAKGCTTYQDIADELIMELQQHDEGQMLQGKECSRKRRKESDSAGYDDGEKNVRRRVYDSLNVLKAIGAVVPLKILTGFSGKEVLWIGLPSCVEEVDAAVAMREELKRRMHEAEAVCDQLQVATELLCRRSQASELFTMFQDNGFCLQATLNNVIRLKALISHNRAQQAQRASAIMLPFITVRAEPGTHVEIKSWLISHAAHFWFGWYASDASPGQLTAAHWMRPHCCCT
jgi:E2F/DP family winged-helix DNA-binding domain